MNTNELLQKKCVPCEGGIPPLTEDEVKNQMKALHPNWKHIENKIERLVSFINFRLAMDFANKVMEIAESEGHHPVLIVEYGKCTVQLWTHAIDGLTENDFILAAKIDQL